MASRSLIEFKVAQSESENYLELTFTGEIIKRHLIHVGLSHISLGNVHSPLTPASQIHKIKNLKNLHSLDCTLHWGRVVPVVSRLGCWSGDQQVAAPNPDNCTISYSKY